MPRRAARSRLALRLSKVRPARPGAGKRFLPLSRRLQIERLEERLTLSAAPLGQLDELYFPASTHLFDSGGFLSGPTEGTPLQIAVGYLASHSSALGLSSADLHDFVVTSQYASPDMGVTHIYMQQTHLGLPVLGANINVNITSAGEVINVGSSFVGGLSDGRRTETVTPRLSASEALAVLAADANWRMDSTPSVLNFAGGLTQSTMLSASGISREDIPAELVFVPTPDGVELAWNMLVQTLDGEHAYSASIGADGGQLLHWSDWIDADSYDVYPLPFENPNDGPRSAVVNPANPTASPYDWHDTNGVTGAEYTVTHGNNVFAYADRNNDNAPDAGSSPDGTAALTFDFPIDLSQAPLSYQPAAVTNLFYWNNILHDVHYHYGFTEAAGNFQTTNYSNGGLGSDEVQAEAQDGAGLVTPNRNNANFFTPPDGQKPRMQMYEFDYTPILRDGDLDAGVIIHEYGHGVSNRLTGGPANSNALDAIQSGGMGEGWSDWWALMFTQTAADTKLNNYPIGTYVVGQPSTGGGIRRYPYSFNMTVDPLTYNHYNSSTEVHNAGEIWASTLWDLNWLLIDDYGYDPNLYTGTGGNNLALQLVTDALKLQPANPSFLDGRDAILLADMVLTGGANIQTIWEAFARRGMGFSASDGGSANATTVIAAFDMPSTSVGAVEFGDTFFELGEPVSVAVRDLDLAGIGTISVQVVSDNGDTESITLTELPLAPGVFQGNIVTSNAAPTAANGVLEVVDGSVITASYLDTNDGTGNSVLRTDTANVFQFVDFFTADLTADPGWSTQGQWAFGHPIGLGGSSHGHPDPNDGATGPNVYGVNLNGDYSTAVGGPFYLTTTAIDTTGYTNVRLEFQRWLNTDYPAYVYATIDVSNDGINWVNVYTNSAGVEIADSSWQSMQYDISSVADNQSTVYIRWGHRVGATAAYAYSGWNIDDVVLSGRAPTGAQIQGHIWNDVDANGQLDGGEIGLENWTVYLDLNNDSQHVTDGNVEPDQYDVGALLNTIMPGATLSAVGGFSPEVYAGVPNGGFASTGSLAFTRNGSFGWGGAIRLRVDFDTLKSTVRLDAIGDDALDVGTLQAYGAGGNLLATYTTGNLTAGQSETMTISRPSADIAYVVAGGLGNEILNLDNLQFAYIDPFTTTDANGDYVFTQLTPGTYRVGQVVQPGWMQTYPVTSPYVGEPVAFEFEDISATGNVGLSPYVDDEFFELSPANLAGFEFDFYGTTYDQLFVSSNGLITFGNGTTNYTNTDLVSSPIEAAIAAYWDDLVVDSSDSPAAALLWEVRGTGDDQRLILQWHQIRYIGGSGQGAITLQAVLWEADGAMQFNYLDLATTGPNSEGASATVGIKNAGGLGNDTLLLSFDSGPNAIVGSGKSVRITRNFAPDLYTVSLGPGESITGLNFGDHQNQLSLLGDYDRNGIVDDGDYVLARKTFGLAVSHPYDGADGDGSGYIDDLDMAVWRANYGNAAPISTVESQAEDVSIDPSITVATTISPLKSGDHHSESMAAAMFVSQSSSGQLASALPEVASQAIDGRVALGQRENGMPRHSKWMLHSERSVADPSNDEALLAWLSQTAMSARVDHEVDGGDSLARDTTDANDSVFDRAIDAFDDQALLTAL